MAVLLAPLSVPLLYQLRPLRVDHHGWQIVAALLAVVALIARPTRRSGVLVGGALAILPPYQVATRSSARWQIRS